MSDTVDLGPMHENLERFVGDWSQEIKITLPDGGTLKGTATTHNTMIYGGRFVEVVADVKLMEQVGEGILYIGYNNLKGAYSFYNMTSVSTDVTFAEGTWDAGANRFVFHGHNVDPVSGKERSFRIEITFLDENAFRQENFFHNPGEEEFRGGRAISARIVSAAGHPWSTRIGPPVDHEG